MNTTRKIVILGMCLLMACGTLFAQKPKKGDVTNPAASFAILNAPPSEQEWSAAPSGTVLVKGGSFTMGQMSEYITALRNSERRTVTVNSFYMDQYEVSNEFWKTYETWVVDVFGDVKPELVELVLPDTTVWRDELAYNDPLVEYYYRHKAYSKYPVVGVTWEQAVKFCQWRTDRENEYRMYLRSYLPDDNSICDLSNLQKIVNKGYLTQEEKEQLFDNPAYPQNAKYADLLKDTIFSITEAKRKGLISDKEIDRLAREGVEEIDMYQLPYEWIRDQFVFNTEKYLYTNYLPLGHKGRKINANDNVLLIGYRLPTEAEWEYAALAQPIMRGDMGMVEQNQIYPWIGYQTRDLRGGLVAKKNPIKSKANFVGARGDMTGGTSNDGGVVTTPVDAYGANGFGLYNMAGNVNEWVMDVYRETTHEEVAEYNAFRGNVYTRIKRDAAGNAVLDAFGAVEREYDLADDKRNFRDGDEGSLFETDYPLDTMNLTAEQKENVKYDPSDVLAPIVNSETRVYKGGSWNDRIYWIEPATRRYLDQGKASSTIGFRCAMSKLGE